MGFIPMCNCAEIVYDRYDSLMMLKQIPANSVCLGKSVFIPDTRNVVSVITFAERSFTFPYQAGMTYVVAGTTTAEQLYEILSCERSVYSVSLPAPRCPVCYEYLASIPAEDVYGQRVIEPYCLNHSCRSYTSNKLSALMDIFPEYIKGRYTYLAASGLSRVCLSQFVSTIDVLNMCDYLRHAPASKLAQFYMVPSALDTFHAEADNYFSTGLRLYEETASLRAYMSFGEGVDSGIPILNTAINVNSRWMRL